MVHRLVPLSIRESHTAAIGIIYAALYVMLGMVVGFSAYLVLSKYNTSQNTAKSEASNVEELYWLAEQLPEPERDEIQERWVAALSEVPANPEDDLVDPALELVLVQQRLVGAAVVVGTHRLQGPPFVAL